MVFSEEMLIAGVQMMQETQGMQSEERVAYIYAAMEGVRRLLDQPIAETMH